MNRRKNRQSKVVYMCLILLIVTASVLVAVASGAGKRSDSGKGTKVTEVTDGVETESYKRPTEDAPVTTEIIETESQPETVMPDRTEGTEDVLATEPAVSLTVDDIAFEAPASGAVLVPCSGTPIYSITMNDYRVHEGVDITAAVGDGVVACAGGVVLEVWDDPMMGRSVRLSHGGGVESVYQNLSEESFDGIEVGAEVSAGALIGAVGDTALIECEEEPHLHFELKVDGVDTDPLQYIAIPTLSEEYEG